MSKSPIFSILKHIDEQNYRYFSTLSDDDKKQVGFMILKWMSCTNDATKLQMLNAVTNKTMFKLSKYPELCYHLMAACGNGREEFYTYRKKKPKTSTRPITVSMLKEFYNISTRDAIEDSELMNVESMLVIANELGRWDEESKLRKEF
jgi:hypothetical protein